jgi:hypothetical protein
MSNDMIQTSEVNVMLAAPMWRATTWISMMGAAFKEADIQRAQLVQNGPWTARTTNVQRYAIDIYV